MFKLQRLYVGTGRCGTGTMAKLSRGTHEKIFGPRGIDFTEPSTCEASWLAVPFMQLGSWETVLVVRHPRDTINSLASQPGLFWGDLSVYGRYIQHWCNGPILPWQFWERWNRWCLESVDKIVRVEDVTLQRYNSRQRSSFVFQFDLGLAKELGYDEVF